MFISGLILLKKDFIKLPLNGIIFKRRKSLEEPTKKPNKISCFIALAILFISYALYYNSLDNDFIWDDIVLIKENRYLKSYKYLPNILTENFGAGSEYSTGDFNAFYRPLAMTSYWLDYHLWGYNPTGYHFTSILIHALTGIVIYLLLLKLFSDPLLAILSALFFIIHPIQTEAVAYIAVRQDPLAAFFLFLTLLLYIYYRRTERLSFYRFSFLCYFLALLSKEISAVFPLVFLLYEYCFAALNKRNFKKILPFLLAAGTFVLLKFTVFSFETEKLRGNTLGIWHRINGFWQSIAQYLGLLILPINQHMEYGMKKFYFLSAGVITGVILTVLLLYIAFRAKKKHPVIFFSILWFFINLLPFTGIYPINSYMAERWLYVPSLGFFIAMAYLLTQGLKKTGSSRILAQFLLITLAIGYSLKTVIHNEYWKDAPTFFTKTLFYADDAYKPEFYYELGRYYTEKKDPQKAMRMYEETIKRQPDYYLAYNGMGNVFLQQKEYDKAVSSYLLTIDLKPSYIPAYTNLAYAYSLMGEYEKAKEIIKRVPK